MLPRDIRAVKHSSRTAVMWEALHPSTKGPSPAPFTRTSALPSLADGEASDPTSLVPQRCPPCLPRVRQTALSEPSVAERTPNRRRLGVPHASKTLLAVTSALIPTKSVLPAQGQLSARITSKAFLAELPALARRPGLEQNVHGGCTVCTSRVQESSVPLCLHREQLVSHDGTAPVWAPKYHCEVVVLL